MIEVPADTRRLGDDELAAVSERLEALPVLEAAREAVDWAIERYGDSISVASSFQDVVLVDLVRKARADIEIIFLDTDFHFPETLAFVERLRRIWDLSLTTTHPSVGLDEFPCGSPRCCEVRKVQPLARALEGRAAWITGLKRVDTPERGGSDPCLGCRPPHGEGEPSGRLERPGRRGLPRSRGPSAPSAHLRGLHLHRLRPYDPASRRGPEPARVAGQAPARPSAGCTSRHSP